MFGINPVLQGAEKILGMNESGELQDLLTKIEVGVSLIILFLFTSQLHTVTFN